GHPAAAPGPKGGGRGSRSAPGVAQGPAPARWPPGAPVGGPGQRLAVRAPPAPPGRSSWELDLEQRVGGNEDAARVAPPRDPDRLRKVEQPGHDRAQLPVRQRIPDAEMRPGAEPQIADPPVDAAIDIEAARSWKPARMLEQVVGVNHDAAAPTETMTEHDRIHLDTAQHDRRRHRQSETFVDGERQQCSMLPNPTHLG